MGKIRATDDEQLATQLWGDNKEWDDDRQQYVPVEGGEPSSLGNSTATSSESTEKNEPSTSKDLRSTAPTTARPSGKTSKASTGARSTDGSGKANR